MKNDKELPTITEDDIPSNKYVEPIVGEWISKCPKCGIKLARAMAYCCPNNQCPTGLGSSSSLIC